MLITEDIVNELKRRNLYFRTLNLDDVRNNEVETPRNYDFVIDILLRNRLPDNIFQDIGYFIRLHDGLMFFKNQNLRDQIYPLLRTYLRTANLSRNDYNLLYNFIQYRRMIFLRREEHQPEVTDSEYMRL